MKLPWICLIALISLATALPDTIQRTEVRRSRTPLKRHDFGIVGGNRTNINKYPYTVSISFAPQSYLIGGGAILNKNWVVCSAFELCNFKSSLNQLSVRTGSDEDQSGGRPVKVSKIIIHENYTGNFMYDIALIKTSTKMKFSKQAKPIRLSKTKPKQGTKAQITGYGGDLVSTGDLLVATVEVKSATECTSQHGKLGDTCMCADSPGVGPCTSDIGAPLVHKKQLLGYYLGGDYCNFYNRPEIYTNIAAMRSWVIETIKTNSNAEDAEGIDDEAFYAAYDKDTDEDSQGVEGSPDNYK